MKSIRDAEITLVKMLAKVKSKKGTAILQAFDSKKEKAVRIYVATTFPEWQDVCVGIVKEAYVKEEDKVDDAKVKELLVKKGLIKDKRAMPFIQAFKVENYIPLDSNMIECLLLLIVETHGAVWSTNSI